MFNAIFIFGPAGQNISTSFRTAEARDTALLKAEETGVVVDDTGQTFDRRSGTVHGVVFTSDESNAWSSLAPHMVQLATNKLVEELKAADPAFREHVAKLQRAQRAQQMGPNGVPILPMQ